MVVRPSTMLTTGDSATAVPLQFSYLIKRLIECLGTRVGKPHRSTSANQNMINASSSHSEPQRTSGLGSVLSDSVFRT